MHEIKYPELITYYIAYEENTVVYGATEPNQVTTTGLENLETFTDFMLYSSRLLQFGIDINLMDIE